MEHLHAMIGFRMSLLPSWINDNGLLKFSFLLFVTNIFTFALWRILDQTIYLEYKIVNQYQNLEQKYQQVETAYQNERVANSRALDQIKTVVTSDSAAIQNDNQATLETLNGIYDAYYIVTQKITRNQVVGLNVSDISGETGNWGSMFLNREYESLINELIDANIRLDQDYQISVSSQ
jgi:hypothetical protein